MNKEYLKVEAVSSREKRIINLLHLLEGFSFSLDKKIFLIKTIGFIGKTTSSASLEIMVKIKENTFQLIVQNDDIFTFLSSIMYENSDLGILPSSLKESLLIDSIKDIILCLDDTLTLRDVSIQIRMKKKGKNYLTRNDKWISLRIILKNDNNVSLGLNILLDHSLENFLLNLNKYEKSLLNRKEDDLDSIPVIAKIILGKTSFYIKELDPDKENSLEIGDIIVIEETPIQGDSNSVWLDFSNKRVLASWEGTKVTILQQWESKILMFDGGSNMEEEKKQIEREIPVNNNSLSDDTVRKKPTEEEEGSRQEAITEGVAGDDGHEEGISMAQQKKEEEKNAEEASVSREEQRIDKGNEEKDETSSVGKEQKEAYLENRTQETINFEEIPVDLVFEVGRLRVPFFELKKMVKGYSFDLNRDIRNPVKVLVNEKVIAYGSIVEIDRNKIGVKLTEIFKSNDN